MKKYYSVKQQKELDKIILQRNHSINFTPSKVEYWNEVINQWKQLNGNLEFRPFKTKNRS